MNETLEHVLEDNSIRYADDDIQNVHREASLWLYDVGMCLSVCK